MVQFTIKDLLENGVHYGHSTRRWNPKMSPYIYGTYNGIHVIDLQKTAPLLANALQNIKEVVSSGVEFCLLELRNKLAVLLKST